MNNFLHPVTIGGDDYLVCDEGFIDYLRDDLGYLSIDINDVFTEFMDWLEDETA